MPDKPLTEAELVFGVGYKRDNRGRPVEQGIGSAAQPSETHFQAIEKYHGREAAEKARAEASERGHASSKSESVRTVRRRKSRPRRPAVSRTAERDGGAEA